MVRASILPEGVTAPVSERPLEPGAQKPGLVLEAVLADGQLPGGGPLERLKHEGTPWAPERHGSVDLKPTTVKLSGSAEPVEEFADPREKAGALRMGLL